jgi:hypothetical protein
MFNDLIRCKKTNYKENFIMLNFKKIIAASVAVLSIVTMSVSAFANENEIPEDQISIGKLGLVGVTPGKQISPIPTVHVKYKNVVLNNATELKLKDGSKHFLVAPNVPVTIKATISTKEPNVAFGYFDVEAAKYIDIKPTITPTATAFQYTATFIPNANGTVGKYFDFYINNLTAGYVSLSNISVSY